MTEAPLIEAIDGFLKKHDMSPVSFGRNALNDPHFVAQLRAGRRTWPETEAKVRLHVVIRHRKCRGMTALTEADIRRIVREEIVKAVPTLISESTNRVREIAWRRQVSADAEAIKGVIRRSILQDGPEPAGGANA